MKLVSFSARGRDRAGFCLPDSDLYVDLAALCHATPGLDAFAPPADMLGLILQGERGWSLLRRAREAVASTIGSDASASADALFRRAQLQLLPPVPNPSKVVAIGLNYRDHCEEQGLPPPEYPTVFAKFPSCLVGDGAPIVYPRESQQLDYEAELAFVIGRTARNVAEEDGLAYVFGYMCFNDVTARDIQKSEKQWVRGKSFDTFGPCGPWLVTADEVHDPHSLAITCKVNGEMRQQGNTKDMLFGVSELVARLSRSFTLYPGDIVLTGTPAGVGVYSKPPRFLQPGDEVEVRIEGLGTLRNSVVAEKEAS